MDFPDVTVRRLAVQRLESLSNDDVMKYLLQLVQVCVCIQTNTAKVCAVDLKKKKKIMCVFGGSVKITKYSIGYAIQCQNTTPITSVYTFIDK